MTRHTKQTRGLGLLGASLVGLAAMSLAPPARADQPLTELGTWSGAIDFFSTGAPLAIDGPDADTTLVDTIDQPASVDVTASEVPASAIVLAAYLYWGGSIVNDDCAGSTIDDTVQLTHPGGNATALTADQCYCADAGASSYDVQLCRKDVTPLIGDMIGTYTVDGFDALIENGATNNASFSVVLVYRDVSKNPRRIGLWDGLQTMHSAVNPIEVVTLSNLDVDNPAEGDLTWYVLEGDFGGSLGEQVSVTGQPGGATAILSDGLNPPDNPMNHTINTTVPTQSWSLGVDIDQLDISAGLTPGDTSVEMTYEAGNDKWWIAYNIVGVNVHEAVFGSDSTKTWALQDDADLNGEPSPGDTVRYTLQLSNSGTAPGVVSLDDPIPAEAESWTMVDTGGGTDASVGNTLVVTGISVPAGGSVDVIFDVVLAVVPNNTHMSNVASFDASPDGDTGLIVAADVVVQSDVPGTGGAGGVGGTGGAGASGAQGGSGGAATGGGPSGGAGGTTSGSSSGSGGASNTRADSSCGCRLAGRSGSAGWLLAAAALAAAGWRRRRRS